MKFNRLEESRYATTWCLHIGTAPELEICAFAVVRTMGLVPEVEKIRWPVVGEIRLEDGDNVRGALASYMARQNQAKAVTRARGIKDVA